MSYFYYEEVSTSSTQTSQTQGIVFTLEGTSLILTIVLSFLALLGIVVRTTTRFNELTSEIKDLKEDLKQINTLEKQVSGLDKKFDIHLQDYVNHKDANLLEFNGLRERIQHNREKVEDKIKDTNADVKEIQQYLQKQQDFRIRRQEED